MEVYLHDERNFYRIVAFDALVQAWKEYNGNVEAIVVVLREHRFSEEEIQQLIEASRN